ncbi:MAG: hypothetical protein MUF00_20515 [Gemmatimonadaceae bacterium]|jgi:hypothetical protein|nr:hypothetical protein [Gemmatimonadaceae bacterium]
MLSLAKHWRPLAVTVLSTVVVACHDAPAAPERPATVDLSTSRSDALKRYGDPVVDSAVRRRVDSVTRELARAMSEGASLRNAVASLRASREDDEHKLTLGQMRAGLTRGQAAALATPVTPHVASVRNFADLDNELEVYMPVAAQREQYTGSQPLVVAYQLLEEENPVGYTASGERVELDVRTAPSVPVLIVVPREDQLKSGTVEAGCENIATSSSAVGTWACESAPASVVRRTDGRTSAGQRPMSDECLPTLGELQRQDCGSPVPVPPPVPGALYLSSAQLSDLHEPWPRGEPEITYFVTTYPTFGNASDTRVSCLSEEPLPNANFFLDQNIGTQSFQLPFSGWSVKHTFLNSGQIQDIEGIANVRGDSIGDVNVTVWEDDTGSRCALEEANVVSKVIGAVGAIVQIIGTVKGYGVCADELMNPGKVQTIKQALKWFKSGTSICGILKIPQNVRTIMAATGGDDDFIGISQQTPNPAANTGSSHVIAASGGQVGRFNLTPINQ